jgi:hypothetical protein
MLELLCGVCTGSHAVEIGKYPRLAGADFGHRRLVVRRYYLNTFFFLEGGYCNISPAGISGKSPADDVIC